MQKSKEKTDQESFVELSWWIVEQKMHYYHLKRAIVADEYYDKLEAEYKALAIKLGLKAYASDMVGFDITRASCRLALEKYSGDSDGQ